MHYYVQRLLAISDVRASKSYGPSCHRRFPLSMSIISFAKIV